MFKNSDSFGREAVGVLVSLPWPYQPLLMLLARSADSELARQVEFLHAENQVLRRHRVHWTLESPRPAATVLPFRVDDLAAAARAMSQVSRRGEPVQCTGRDP